MHQQITPTQHIPNRSVSPSSRARKGKNVPRIRSFSLLGSASEIQRDPLGFLIRTQALGDVVRLRFLLSPAYLIAHPGSIKHILLDNYRNYNKDIPTYTMLKPMLGQGLLTNDGQSWLHQRRLIQPAFHRKRLTTYGTSMTDATVAMLDRWQAKSSAGEMRLNMAEEMMRLTLRIVGQALFSLDLSQETSTIGQAVTASMGLLTDYIFRPFPPLGVPTPRNQRLQAAIHALDQVVYRTIAERRKLQMDTGDLLSMLLLAQDEETGQGMNDQQVRDELQTLLLAGHETTANTLAWTWYLLSEHPEAEQRLHSELNDVLGGRVPTVEDLPALKYTRMVIEEAMRLYPAAPALSRKAIADDELEGCHIPANSMVLISPYAMHHHPVHWEEPEQFKPERFDPEHVAARPPYVYFPFGGGPRMCIGNNFSMMESQLVLATVAQRYQLRLVPGHKVEPQMLLTLRPRYGLAMTIQARGDI